MVMLSADLRAVGKGLTHLRNSDEAERHPLSLISPKGLLYWFPFVTGSKLKNEDLIDPVSKFSTQRMQGSSAAEGPIVFGPGEPSHCCQIHAGHSHFSQAAVALLPGAMQRSKVRVNHGCPEIFPLLLL